MDLIAQFVSKHARFFDSYGNWVLVPLFVLVLILDHRVVKRKFDSKFLKSGLRFIFICAAFLLGTLIYTTNFPLKPMVKSISKVQKTIGQAAPNFEFLNVHEDKAYNISDFKGQILLLNFWGTYCAPCIEEFPDLNKVDVEFGSKARVIALSDEDKNRILKFIQRVESPAIVGSFSKEKWIELENFRPLTVVIDQQGIVQEYVFGKKDYSYFKSIIEKYL